MYHRYQLPSGAQVLFVPLTGAQTTTVMVAAKVGSRYETEQQAGLSHFLEHFMFKGNKRYPTTLALSRTLDAVGADYNAFTSKEWTAYYVKLAARHLPLAVDVVSQMLLTSKFDPKEMEREKEVVVEEMHLYRDNPLLHIEDILEREMFKGSTLGRDIIGTAESVRALTRQQLVKFWQEHYRGQNLTIVVAGGFELEEAESLVKKSFAFSNGRVLSSFKKFRDKQTAPRVRLDFKETEQIQLALGFPGVGRQDPRRFPLAVLATVLGGNMSSRLFIKIRERQGLCYSIRAVSDSFMDTGSFVIRAGLDKQRIKEAIRRIRAELDKAVKGGVTKDELAKAKDYLTGQQLLRLEDTAEVATWFTQQAMFQDKILTPNEALAKIQTVTVGQVKAVARRFIRPSKATLALIGPFQEKEEFLKLLK